MYPHTCLFLRCSDGGALWTRGHVLEYNREEVIMNNMIRFRPFIAKESSTCVRGIQNSIVLVLVFSNWLIEMACSARTTIG